MVQYKEIYMNHSVAIDDLIRPQNPCYNEQYSYYGLVSNEVCKLDIVESNTLLMFLVFIYVFVYMIQTFSNYSSFSIPLL